MASSDLLVSLIGSAMRLEQARAHAASYNIATANVPGSRAMRVDFAAQLQVLSAAASAPDATTDSLAPLLQQDFAPTPQPANATRVSLDEEVANLAESESRYKALAEGLSRHFSLLSLSVTGRQ